MQGSVIMQRRTLLGALALLPAKTIAAPSIAEFAKKREDGVDFAEVMLTYRGVHFGTHKPVYYERISRITREGYTWNETASEIHDGDVLTGPTALPRVQHGNSIDIRSGMPVFESLKVYDKPIAWSYRFDRGAGKVNGSKQLGGEPVSVSGTVSANGYSGDALQMVLAGLPLTDGLGVEHRLIDIEGNNIIEVPITIEVTRRQYVRIDGQDLPVFRVEITSKQAHLAGTGIYLTLAKAPHWVVRAEYQSTHMDGPPLFDSRGADILTAISYSV